MGVCLTLLECTCLSKFISSLKKREGDWSGNAPRNCFWDRYWGPAGQLLANFSLSQNSPQKFSGLSFPLDSKVARILKTSLLWDAFSKLSCIFVVVVFQVSLVLVFMVGVIVYKLLIYRPLSANPSTRARAPQIANITGAFVNLTIIMILSRVCSVYFIYACL